MLTLSFPTFHSIQSSSLWGDAPHIQSRFSNPVVNPLRKHPQTHRQCMLMDLLGASQADKADDNHFQSWDTSLSWFPH